MSYLFDNIDWLLLIAAISFVLTCLYLYFELKVIRAKSKLRFERERLRQRILKVNLVLLQAGMTTAEILEFWEDCMAEAHIQHNLPPCSCKDVNECETWCRAKARFAMNPPED